MTPGSTTTYTAKATNSHGSTTAQITITVAAATAPTVSIKAANSSITAGSSDTLTVTASNASSVAVSGSDGSSYTLSSSGGTLTVAPTQTTTYTAEAMNSSGKVASAETTVTVGSSSGLNLIQHVVFMLQENRTFDEYFGMLNPYRHANGWDMGERWQDLRRGWHRRQADHNQQSGRRGRRIPAVQVSIAPASMTTLRLAGELSAT